MEKMENDIPFSYIFSIGYGTHAFLFNSTFQIIDNVKIALSS